LGVVRRGLWVVLVGAVDGVRVVIIPIVISNEVRGENFCEGCFYADTLRPCMFAVSEAEDFSLSFEMTGGVWALPAARAFRSYAHRP